MTRPTKELVDEALEYASGKQPRPGNFSPLSILAAEVGALRAELAGKLELRIDFDLLSAEVDKLRALKMLVIAYKRDFEENHTDAIASRYELFEALDDPEGYHAEVDKLRGDEQDAWARLGAELCEAETERDRLRAEVDKLRALKMLVLAYKRDCDSENVDPYDARCELFEAL